MGHVGRQIALLLRRLGHEVTVITQKPREDWMRGAQEAGISILLGDARDSQLLYSAGIERAQALLATTSQDALNIEIALDARRVRPDLPVVVRLFDQTLARSVEGAVSFGVRRALGVSTLAAPTLVAALLGTGLQASFSLSEHQPPERESPEETLVVCRWSGALPSAEVGIPLDSGDPGGSLVLTSRAAWEARMGAAKTASPESQKLSWGRRQVARLRVFGEMWRNAPAALRSVLAMLCLLIAASVMVFRVGMNLGLVDAFYFIVTTVTTTGYGDITPKDSGAALKLYACLMMVLGSAATALVYSLLTDFVVNERFRSVLGQQRIPEKQHVIVVGLGNVGYRVLEELRRQGLEVVAINRTDEGEFFEAVRSLGPTIVGDGRLPDTLRRAAIQGARGLVAATDDDATNLAIALETRRMRPDLPVVVRLLDAEFAGKVRHGLALPSAFSSAALAAPTFIGAALFDGVRAAVMADSTLFTLVERRSDASWEGKRAAQIEQEFGVRPVVRIETKDSRSLPVFLTDTSAVRAGERLLVLARHALKAN